MKVLITILLLSLLSNTVMSQQNDPNLSGGFEAPPEETVEQLENEILSYLEPYIYDAERRRDPFQPFRVFVQEPSPEDQFREEPPIQNEMDKQAIQPLLRYNLNQLNLKAILWNVKNPKIIVNDPTDKLHILITNDRIGNNGGYIAAIREGEVVVVQKANVEGKEIVTTKYMRLKR